MSRRFLGVSVVKSRQLLAGSSLAVLALAASASGALAQQAGPQVQEVVVTGSRVQASGFVTPTPVTAVTQRELEMKAPGNIAALVADIPQLRPNQTTNSSVDVGAAAFDLRGLGANRTLVLIDGRRQAATSVNGGFDINTIPAGLVSQVEVVTGGASAAYGSDAVAGVVNLTLDTGLRGFKGSAQYGESKYHDHQNYTFTGAYGLDFGGGSGHLVMSADYYQNSGVKGQATRPWGQSAWGLLTNPNYVAGNGSTKMVIAENTVNSQITPGGVIITAGPLKNIQFGPGGTPMPFVLGTNVGNSFMTGGDGARLGDMALIEPEVDRRTLFAHATYDFGENLRGWAEGRYARSHQFYYVIPNYDNGTLVIARDNAFLPASIRQTMVANNIQSVRMGRVDYDLGTEYNGSSLLNGENTVKNISGGLEGKFGGGWSWDASAAYTKNTFYTSIGQNRIEQNWLNAVDSVISPTTGQPVCRSTLTNPSNGCVPANLFGPGSISQAVRDYATGTSWVSADIDEVNVEANVRGEPFSTWAGPAPVAAGVAWRKDSVDSTSDAVSQALGWRSANATPFSGEVKVLEGYAEAVVPLAKEAPWAYAADINGAVRVTDYSTSGSVTTWKIGGNYSPIEGLRFRVTRSRDIRAPSLTELYTTGVLRAGTTVTDRQTNRQYTVSSLAAGNPKLNPEVGDTLTLGGVWSPSWFRGFTASVDYYDIKVAGAITTPTQQEIVDQCAAGQTVYCASVVRDGAGAITQVGIVPFNAQKFKASGVDFEASYRVALEDISSGLRGDLAVRLLGSHVAHLTTINFGTAIEKAGQVGQNATSQTTPQGAPKWRFGTNFLYRLDRLSVNVGVNYVGGGKYNSTYVEGVDINDNSIPSRTYVSTAVDYEVKDGIRVFAKVDNLFNVAPPPTPSTTILPNGFYSSWYDRIGRVYTAGVRLRF